MAWETLFEAAATLRLLRADELADLIASGAILEIQVREPATTHTLTVAAGDGATAWRSALTKYRSENE